MKVKVVRNMDLGAVAKETAMTERTRINSRRAFRARAISTHSPGDIERERRTQTAAEPMHKRRSRTRLTSRCSGRWAPESAIFRVLACSHAGQSPKRSS
jgi:hypothetical protein